MCYITLVSVSNSLTWLRAHNWNDVFRHGYYTMVLNVNCSNVSILLFCVHYSLLLWEWRYLWWGYQRVLLPHQFRRESVWKCFIVCKWDKIVYFHLVITHVHGLSVVASNSHGHFTVRCLLLTNLRSYTLAYDKDIHHKQYWLYCAKAEAQDNLYISRVGHVWVCYITEINT